MSWVWRFEEIFRQLYQISSGNTNSKEPCRYGDDNGYFEIFAKSPFGSKSLNIKAILNHSAKNTIPTISTLDFDRFKLLLRQNWALLSGETWSGTILPHSMATLHRRRSPEVMKLARYFLQPIVIYLGSNERTWNSKTFDVH